MNLNTWKGAAIGFLLLFDVIFIIPLVFLCIRGQYPDFLVAPDDPKSPFGLYEPAMRDAYGSILPKGWRRWWGDFKWLALRNRAYGLTYRFKPLELFPDIEGHYPHVSPNPAPVPGRVMTYSVYAGGKVFSLLRIHLFDIFGHPFGLMIGWKVDGMVLDPNTHRAQVNMEGRPIFSPRRLD